MPTESTHNFLYTLTRVELATPAKENGECLILVENGFSYTHKGNNWQLLSFTVNLCRIFRFSKSILAPTTPSRPWKASQPKTCERKKTVMYAVCIFSHHHFPEENTSRSLENYEVNFVLLGYKTVRFLQRRDRKGHGQSCVLWKNIGKTWAILIFLSTIRWFRNPIQSNRGLVGDYLKIRTHT